MSAYLQGQGVDFRYGVQIRRLAGQGGRIAGVETDQGTLTADAYVVALGGQSSFLLRPLGMTLPIYPLKGYSITADVTDAGRAPQAAIMDEHNKVMISRLGSRIRAAGMAELKGYGLEVDAGRVAFLTSVVREWFPQGIALDRPSPGLGCGR